MNTEKFHEIRDILIGSGFSPVRAGLYRVRPKAQKVGQIVFESDDEIVDIYISSVEIVAKKSDLVIFQCAPDPNELTEQLKSHKLWRRKKKKQKRTRTLS